MRYDSWSKRIINLLYPLAAYMAVGLAVMGIAGTGNLTTNLIEKLLCIAVMSVLYCRDQKSISREVPAMPAPAAFALLAAAAGAAAALAGNSLLQVSGLQRLLQEDYKAVEQALYRDSLWLELLTVVAAAPIAEELLFRGILYKRLRTYAGAIPAAAVSILIFAVCHGNLLQGLYAALLGCVIVWFYEKTCRLAVAVLVHIGANALSVLVTHMPGVSAFLGAHLPAVFAAGTVVLAGVWYAAAVMLRGGSVRKKS